MESSKLVSGILGFRIFTGTNLKTLKSKELKIDLDVYVSN